MLVKEGDLYLLAIVCYAICFVCNMKQMNSIFCAMNIYR